ncbi:MAG: hypothetical protein ABSF91_15100 [Bacteroidota bacterium]|jgi:hypothetical protein
MSKILEKSPKFDIGQIVWYIDDIVPPGTTHTGLVAGSGDILALTSRMIYFSSPLAQERITGSIL